MRILNQLRHAGCLRFLLWPKQSGGIVESCARETGRDFNPRYIPRRNIAGSWRRDGDRGRSMMMMDLAFSGRGESSTLRGYLGIDGRRQNRKKEETFVRCLQMRISPLFMIYYYRHIEHFRRSIGYCSEIIRSSRS